MTTMTLPMEAGCRCNQVRMRITAPPVMTMACHCTGCQRMTGSAFSLTVMVPDAGFEVVAGDPVIGGLHGASNHHCCPYCMSWIFSRPERLKGFVNMRATMLDDTSWFVPFGESWTSEKLAWATTPAVYSFPEFPPPEETPALLEAFARKFRSA